MKCFGSEAEMTIEEAITRTLAMKGARGRMQERRTPARLEDVKACQKCGNRTFWKNLDGDLECRACAEPVYLT